MTAALITWASVAALLIVFILYRIYEDHTLNSRGSHRRKRKHAFKVIEIGKERDEFFITGDLTDVPYIDEYDRDNI